LLEKHYNLFSQSILPQQQQQIIQQRLELSSIEVNKKVEVRTTCHNAPGRIVRAESENIDPRHQAQELNKKIKELSVLISASSNATARVAVAEVIIAYIFYSIEKRPANVRPSICISKWRAECSNIFWWHH